MKQVHKPLIMLGIAAIFSGCTEGGQKTTKKEPATHKEKTMKNVTLDSGLQYEVLKPAATGAQQAQNGQVVTVHYTGWLTNGTKFDSSVDRGTPFSFVLGGGQVIQGWEQGVKGMHVGEKRKLTIPAHLGYGARGAGRVIPANATLIFEVELLGVK